MDTTESDADGCILLEYEGEWSEEQRYGAQLRRPSKRLRQRLRLGALWKRKH